MIILAVRNTGHISFRNMELYLSRLPIEEQARILQYSRLKDKQRALLGILTVFYMFQQYYPHINAKQWYRRDKRGRPYLEASSFWQGDFNISHAGNWVVCALIEKGKVGVDVEEIQPLDWATVLACLTTEERISLLRQTKENKWISFYEQWTRKEAIGKAIGTGLLTPAHIFSREANRTWAIRHYRIDETHLCCVCASTGEFPEHVLYMNDTEIVT